MLEITINRMLYVLDLKNLPFKDVGKELPSPNEAACAAACRLKEAQRTSEVWRQFRQAENGEGKKMGLAGELRGFLPWVIRSQGRSP